MPATNAILSAKRNHITGTPCGLFLRDGLAQRDTGIQFFDGFYRKARDAAEAPHTWPANKPGLA